VRIYLEDRGEVADAAGRARRWARHDRLAGQRRVGCDGEDFSFPPPPCAPVRPVGLQEEVVRPSVTLEAADTADQVLYGMQHYVTDQDYGARWSKPTPPMSIRTRRGRDAGREGHFLRPGGEITSTVTGDSGTYLTRDGSMSARGMW
jgi:hypothetical protein